MDTLYIVIPAYNESENIKRTIEEWCPVVEKHNGGGASRLLHPPGNQVNRRRSGADHAPALRLKAAVSAATFSKTGHSSATIRAPE